MVNRSNSSDIQITWPAILWRLLVTLLLLLALAGPGLTFFNLVTAPPNPQPRPSHTGGTGNGPSWFAAP